MASFTSTICEYPDLVWLRLSGIYCVAFFWLPVRFSTCKYLPYRVWNWNKRTLLWVGFYTSPHKSLGPFLSFQHLRIPSKKVHHTNTTVTTKSQPTSHLHHTNNSLTYHGPWSLMLALCLIYSYPNIIYLLKCSGSWRPRSASLYTNKSRKHTSSCKGCGRLCLHIRSDYIIFSRPA